MGRGRRNPIPGGLGVRKKLAEQSYRTSYRLNGIQKGATVARCLDKYGRWEGGYELGTLVRQTRDTVWILWDGDEEPTRYLQGDARYEKDRDRWRFTNPRRGNPLDPGGRALTTAQIDASILLGRGEGPRKSTEEVAKMAAGTKSKKSTKSAPKKEQSNAAAERESAAKIKDELPERETYTAKQVATRCGTDAKTMRKFFRSSSSTVEPVGQGGRYEFDADDLPTIKEEFERWLKGSKAGSAAGKGPKSGSKKTKAAAAPVVVEVEEDDEELDDEEGPDEDDLEDLDLDFEDDDE